MPSGCTSCIMCPKISYTNVTDKYTHNESHKEKIWRQILQCKCSWGMSCDFINIYLFPSTLFCVTQENVSLTYCFIFCTRQTILAVVSRIYNLPAALLSKVRDTYSYVPSALLITRNHTAGNIFFFLLFWTLDYFCYRLFIVWRTCWHLGLHKHWYPQLVWLRYHISVCTISVTYNLALARYMVNPAGLYLHYTFLIQEFLVTVRTYLRWILT